MTDLEKLEEIYEIFNEALRDIQDISGELSDHDLGYEIDKIYNKIDDLQTEVYRLMQERE